MEGYSAVVEACEEASVIAGMAHWVDADLDAWSVVDTAAGPCEATNYDSVLQAECHRDRAQIDAAANTTVHTRRGSGD